MSDAADNRDPRSAPGGGAGPGAGVPTPGQQSSGLKLVTVSPGSVSAQDGDLAQFLQESLAQPQASTKSDPYLGFTIDGRYKIEAVLGEGGMGVVYRCTHKIIGKKVAMKVLRADMARDTEVTERFLNEAKSASAIGNPHIIDISDFGQLPDGSTYFVMEYLDGIPLTHAVEGGSSVPVGRLVHIARQLAEGLAAAHEAGIVHRDLKPDNIFLVPRGGEKDFVKILDFGIAKVSSASGEKLTRAGQVFGTPHYMSPEQAAGAPIDHRCDIYSFGVILYELASGKVPFDADNFMGILTQHMYKAPVPIRALVPAPQDVPPGLEAIVLKCLSKRPEQRYQTMRELLEDLDKLKEGLVPTAVGEMMQRSGGFNVPADYFAKGPAMPQPVPASPESRGGGRSRAPLIAMIAGIAAAIGIVVAIFAKSSSSDAQSVTPKAEVAEVAKPAKPAEAAATAKAAAQQPGKQVVVVVEPLDAHVFKGEEDLGASPAVINVPEGTTLALEARREGYKSKPLSIDGSQPREVVKLDKDKSASGAGGGPAPKTAGAEKPASAPVDTPPPAPRPKPKAKIGGGEIVNPWE